jgi:2-polyprenyl-3-methyl-5-hydroxy-6-metoxy-1,4-benzoquinol methylase
MRAYVEVEYSGGAYRDYVQAAGLKYATFERRVRQIQAIAPERKLVDVGAPCGYFVEVARRAGFEASGIESSAEAVAAANPAIADKLQVGELDLLSGACVQFDVITAFDVLEHMVDPLHFLATVRDLLNTEGLIILTTPDTGHVLRYLMRSYWPMLQPLQLESVTDDHSRTLLIAPDAIRPPRNSLRSRCIETATVADLPASDSRDSKVSPQYDLMGLCPLAAQFFCGVDDTPQSPSECLRAVGLPPFDGEFG